MNDMQRIELLASAVKEYHSADTTGQGWWPIWRVWQLACYIAGMEQANRFWVEVAALRHDLDDWKLQALACCSEYCALPAHLHLEDQGADPFLSHIAHLSSINRFRSIKAPRERP